MKILAGFFFVQQEIVFHFLLHKNLTKKKM